MSPDGDNFFLKVMFLVLTKIKLFFFLHNNKEKKININLIYMTEIPICVFVKMTFLIWSMTWATYKRIYKEVNKKHYTNTYIQKYLLRNIIKGENRNAEY